jgi:micrococcal nuclease
MAQARAGAPRTGLRAGSTGGVAVSRVGRFPGRRLTRRAGALLGAGLTLTLASLPLASLPLAAPAGASPYSVATTVSSGQHAITQYGTVVFVADGDTIDVKIDGVAADPGRAGTRVRFLTTQAMELYEYHADVSLDRGECHAVEATKRLKSLLFDGEGVGRRVRLTARDASSANQGRESRFVAVRGSDGTWKDVGAIMVREGQVIPSYQKVEYTNNRTYRALAQTAAAKGIGLWDTNFCGSGPAANLSVRVRWDAEGNDAQNVNGEYVKVTNHGRSGVSLAGWWVRDSGTRPASSKTASRRGYIFPAGARVAAGKSVYVHIGKKPANPAAGHFYYGLSSPIFENVTAAPAYLGDGAYLFDPRGNLREWQQYPCVSKQVHACTT